MKKLITIALFLSLTVVGFGQLLAPKGIKVGTGVTAKTLSVAELGYLDGVTSPIQTQFDDFITGIALADSNKTNGTGYTTPLALATKAPLSANNIGFSMTFDPLMYTSPADNATYYYGGLNTAGLQTNTSSKAVLIPFNCTLIGYTLVTQSTAACSAETGTLSVRINSTDTELSNAITWGVGGAYYLNYFSSVVLNISITAGDKMQMKILTPTWPVTNASSIYMTTTLYFKNR